MRGIKSGALCVFWCCAALALSCASARAQGAAEGTVPGVVSGRVTAGEGRPAVGVPVIAFAGEFGPRQRTVARATTDEEGRYTLADLPAGRYRVMPFAPAFFAPESRDYPPGTSVNVSAGEKVEEVNFTLARGGVITGRVTDPEGRPLVNQYVRLAPADAQPRPVPPPLFGRGATDDRGVYRLYGLPPGRYRVYAGEGGDRFAAFSGPQRVFARTFHPDALEEAQARIVEVTAGSETTDVDIRIATAVKTYKLSGRVVDADTGQPVPDLLVRHGLMRDEGRRLSGGIAVTRTDARGEFRFETLVPGGYGAYAGGDGEGEWYSDTTQFEVKDADVSGVELKVRRGVSVTGVVALEGASDRAVLARLSSLEFSATTQTQEASAAPSFSRFSAGPDGSFRVAGLRPGRVRFQLFPRPQHRGFLLLRVERGGVAQPEGVEVAPGEQLTGVRLVVGYGAGVIRGRVLFEGGAPPPDLRLNVFVRRAGAERGGFVGSPMEVDSRGLFVLEGLVAGEYEVLVRAVRRGAGQPLTVRQNVTVGASGETQVTLTLEPPK